jgi:PKD domain-containing protein
MPRLLFTAILLVGVVACAGSMLEPLPLDVNIEASRATAAPGDTIIFVVNAQGGSLFGVEVSYGDSVAEQFGTGGARTARVTFRHAYLLRGTYQVRAVVTDAIAGQKEATTEVRVN